MKNVPAAPRDIALQPSLGEKPTTRAFLMIREREFANLFDDPVVRHQKMSKYFDEQDFNSDCETIERNQNDLLKQLEQGISRFCKTDPTKFVENLKNSATEIEAGKLAARVATIKDE